jgi:DNA topoisomerase I
MPRNKVLATVVRLMEVTFIRVGNEEYARENRSYGLTTMRGRHVRIDGSTVTFKFQVRVEYVTRSMSLIASWR